MEVEMETTSQFGSNHQAERFLDQSLKSKGNVHACRASQRDFQQARDRLKRANRDVGETAAFLAASLTTVTAIQAVISLANKELELSREILQLAFLVYIVLFVLLLVLGTLRVANALHRRAKAEREIDRTKKGIYDFCSVEEWPRIEE
jgi:hypothetical protein